MTAPAPTWREVLHALAPRLPTAGLAAQAAGRLGALRDMLGRWLDEGRAL